MNFLPVLQRELLVEARRGAGAWLRFLAVLLGLGFFALLWSTPLRLQPQRVSDVSFTVLASALFVFAALAGVLYTTDAITSEKREGTLGLLFLTELRGYDIVLGKLAATSMRSAYVVLALIPVLALPVLVGGVSGGQVVRTVTVLCVTLAASLAVGMIASTLAREFRTALVAAALAMGVLTVGLDGGGWVWQRLTGRTADPVRQWSPLAAFRWAQPEPWRKPTVNAAFHRAWKRQALGAALLFVGASVAVRHYRERAVPQRVVAEGEGRVGRGNLVGYRHWHWGELLEREPYGWFHQVMRPLPALFAVSFYALAGASAVALGVSVAMKATAGAWWAVGVSLALLWLMHVLLKLHVTLAATRGVAEDRASGALELLVVAGLGRDQIVPAHRSAILRQHRVPLLVTLAFQFLPMARLSMSDMVGPEATAVWAGLTVGGVVMWFDLEALIQVGLRQGLRESDPQAAFRLTFLRILLPGWLGMMPIAAMVVSGVGGVAMFLGVGAWLLATGYVLRRLRKRARVDLEHGFRELAAGVDFDTDDWELRDDFRRAAGAQYAGGSRVA